MPGNDAICLEGIFGVAGNSILPTAGQAIEGMGTKIVEVDVMPWCFFWVGTTSTIGVGGMGSEVLDVVPEKGKYFWW
jgi:hypothetical protein